VRARARRPIEPARRPDRTEGERPARLRSRQAMGPVRATDPASPVLERAATAERTYVVRDFGRLGKVAAVMLALLVASGFGVDLLLR